MLPFYRNNNIVATCLKFQYQVFGVYLGVKTCEVFLCFLAIIFLGSIVHWLLSGFFVFIVLGHSWVSQVFTPRMRRLSFISISSWKDEMWMTVVSVFFKCFFLKAAKKRIEDKWTMYCFRFLRLRRLDESDLLKNRSYFWNVMNRKKFREIIKCKVVRSAFLFDRVQK